MFVLSLVIFLSAVAGNTAIWAYGINFLYGTRFRGWWVSLLRHLFQAAVVLNPLLFLWFFGRQAIVEGDWANLPRSLLAYLMLCWFLGFVIVPLCTAARWLRRIPSQQLANHTVVVDVAKEIGRRPYGWCRKGPMAYFPFNQIFQVEFTERTLVMPQLPGAWDGLTILQVSDLHLCGSPEPVFYERVMDRCAEAPPDLLVITGDILDSEEHYNWVKSVLGRLRWRLHAFGVLGNHDSWLDAPRIVRPMEELGIEMIGGRWKSVEVRGEPMIVIGNEMPWLGPLPDLTKCPPNVFRLLLSHSPDQLPWARRNQIDLMLAGHNHGGQIRFPLIGPLLVPSRYSRRYDHGLFFEPPTLLHVNRGLGGTYPLRYNCRPEVTRIMLRTRAVKP
jgi:hypothetical protein